MSSINNFVKPSSHILFVVGTNMLKSSIKLLEFKKHLESLSHHVETIQKKRSFIDESEIITFSNKNEIPNLIVCVGGGSVIDYAKALIFYNFKRKRKEFKFFAIPTTCGSGSESTEFAVIYNKGIKKSLVSKELKPDYVILEPKFLNEIPKQVLWSSISDSFSQSLESLWSKNASSQSISYSTKALTFLKSGISDVNKLDKEKLLLASYYSGCAINLTKTTAPHAFSYFLTIKFSVPHGFAVLFTLKEFIKINLASEESKVNFFKKLGGIYFQLNDLYLVIDKILKESGYKYLLDISSFNDCEKYINEDRLNNNPVKISKRNFNSIYINSLKYHT